jgi:predicted glutamine amidotransferase
MCGIIGFVTPDPRAGSAQRSNFLGQGLITDSLRGVSGTGLALVKHNYEVETYRKALPGADFVNSTVAEMAFSDIDLTRIAIGHNRAATIGSTKDRNCHPFHYTNKREVALVHNGTLHNHRRLTPPSFNHDVDSAHAAYAISDSDDIAETLRDITGPFVFVWWDGKERTFNIARNEFREIYYVTANDGTLFFGSEFRMVDWLLERNNIDIGNNKYLYPPDHEWYSWEISDTGISKKPARRDITPKKVVAYHNVGGYNHSTINTDKDERGQQVKDFLAGKEIDIGEVYICKSVVYVPYANGMHTSNKNHQYGRISATIVSAKGELTIWIHGVTASRFEYISGAFLDGLPVRIAGAQQMTVNNPGEFVALGEIRASDLKKVRNGEELKNNSKEIVIANNLDGFELFPGPRGMLNSAIWETLVQKGCAYCNNVPQSTDAFKMEWIPNSTPPDFLCGGCTVDMEARELSGLPILAPRAGDNFGII